MTSFASTKTPVVTSAINDWTSVADGNSWTTVCHGMATAFDIAFDVRGRALGPKEYAVVVHALEVDGSRTEPRPESTWTHSTMVDGYYKYLGNIPDGAQWIAPKITFDTPVAGIEISVVALPKASKTAGLEVKAPWVGWIEPFPGLNGQWQHWPVIERAQRKAVTR